MAMGCSRILRNSRLHPPTLPLDLFLDGEVLDSEWAFEDSGIEDAKRVVTWARE